MAFVGERLHGGHLPDGAAEKSVQIQSAPETAPVQRGTDSVANNGGPNRFNPAEVSFTQLVRASSVRLPLAPLNTVVEATRGALAAEPSKPSEFAEGTAVVDPDTQNEIREKRGAVVFTYHRDPQSIPGVIDMGRVNGRVDRAVQLEQAEAKVREKTDPDKELDLPDVGGSELDDAEWRRQHEARMARFYKPLE